MNFGINESMVPNAISALESFKNILSTTLDTAKQNIDTSTAFIGAQQSTAINTYLDACFEAIKTFYDFIDGKGAYAGQGFTDNLNAAKEAYAAYEASVAQSATSAASNVSSGAQ